MPRRSSCAAVQPRWKPEPRLSHLSLQAFLPDLGDVAVKYLKSDGTTGPAYSVLEVAAFAIDSRPSSVFPAYERISQNPLNGRIIWGKLEASETRPAPRLRHHSGCRPFQRASHIM